MKDTTQEFYRTLDQRRAALKLLAEGDSLDDAKIEGEVPGFPGLIQRAAAERPQLFVTCGPWQGMSTNAGNPDSLTFYMLDDENADLDAIIPLTTMEVSAPPDTVSINIPLARRREGQYWLVYSVYTAEDGQNTSFSLPQPFVIDKTSPYTGFPGAIPPPKRPADMPASVGKEYWDDPIHNGAALYTIDDYSNWGLADGDYVLIYANGSDTPLQLLPVDESNPPVPREKWLLDATRTFPVTWATVMALVPNGVGTLKFSYELYDAAGNNARRSASSLDVTLNNLPEPTLLLPPTIDRATPAPPGDNLIDRNDTLLDRGMVVRIPEYTNYVRGSAGDSFIVTLSVAGGTPVVLPAEPLGTNTFPARVPVSIGQLLSVYGAATGPVTMTVSYEVQRGANKFPLPPALPPSSTVNLDLFFPAGPTPTSEPELVNTNLLAPHIFGTNADGTFGPDADMLTRAHANRPAQARATLWNVPPLPGVGTFEMVWYYNDKVAARTTVTGGVAGQVVTASIPWALIQSEGNGDKTLNYTVGVSGRGNVQLSPQTFPVNVQANFKYLAPPVIQRRQGLTSANQNGTVNCDSFLPKVQPGKLTVFIPPSEHFVRGEAITVVLEGYSDNAGTIPVPAATVRVEAPRYDPVLYRNGYPVDIENFLASMKLIQPDLSLRNTGSLRVYYETNLSPEGLTKSDEARPTSRSMRAGTGGAWFYCDNIQAPLP